MRVLSTGFVFGHVVPRKGLAHCHRAKVMIEDIARLGHDRIMLKGDNEPAIRSQQEEVQRRRAKPTVLENSEVGQSASNGVAERAVQALSEHIHVMTSCLQSHVKIGIPPKNPVIAWRVEHEGELIS